MKKCSKCKEEKSLSEFSKDGQMKNGLSSRCRLCQSIERKQKRKDRTKEQIETEREYKRIYNSSEDRKATSKILMKRWAENNKDKLRSHADKYRFSDKGKDKIKEYKQSDACKKVEKEYRERSRKKDRAQNKARRAISKGILTRMPCEVCGIKIVHAHHTDYEEPLTVMWLCQKHHAEWHRNNGPGLNGE